MLGEPNLGTCSLQRMLQYPDDEMVLILLSLYAYILYRYRDIILNKIRQRYATRSKVFGGCKTIVYISKPQSLSLIRKTLILNISSQLHHTDFIT